METNPLRESLEKAFEEHDVNFEDNSPPASPSIAQKSEPETEEQEVSQEEVAEVQKVSDEPPVKTKSKAADDKSSKKPQGDTATKAAEAAKPTEPQIAEVEPPPFWKAQDREIWAKVPPEARAAIKKYEDGRNLLATRLKQAVNEKIGNWADAQFDEVFPKERITALKLEGKTPASATAALWNWNDYLEESPEAAILEIMDRYELTPEMLANARKGRPAQQAPIQDPRVDQLIQQQEQTQEMQRQAQVRAALDAFGAEVSESGAPLRPYWKEAGPYIKGILPVVKSQNPDMNDYEALHQAYEMAVYANPHLRAKVATPQPQQQVKFDANKTLRAKEAASSLTGSSSQSAELPKTAKTVREALNLAYAEHGGS